MVAGDDGEPARRVRIALDIVAGSRKHCGLAEGRGVYNEPNREKLACNVITIRASSVRQGHCTHTVGAPLRISIAFSGSPSFPKGRGM